MELITRGQKDVDNDLKLLYNENMKTFMDKAYEMPMAEKGELLSPEQLVRSHLRLVIGIARKKYYNSPYFEDIVQDGNLALWKAAKNFDPSLGYNFASYATPVVTMTMMNSALKHNSMISLLTSKPLKKAYFNLDKYRIAGKSLTDEQRIRMSKELDIKIEDIRELEERMALHITSDSPVATEHRDEFDDIFTLVEDDSLEPTNVLENLERQNLVTHKFQKAVETLSDKERYIIEQRWMQETPKTLAVLGKELGISGQRVDQYAKKALSRIREELIDDYC